MFGRMMVSAIALMGVAHAQETGAPTAPQAAPADSSDRASYEPSFFAQFSPQTALDMVRQTPGFSLNGGEERRGFSGAVGNLLIDGERPIAKSQSLESILGRIPASQVVRIEVLRGAAVAGDASGQAALLNVVRTPTAGSGIWQAGFEYNRNRISPQGETSWSGRSGRTEYGVGASWFSQARELPGWRRTYNGAGAFTGYVDTPSPRNYREGSLNGNFATPVLDGRLNITAQLNWWRFHSNNGLIFFNPAGAKTETFSADYTEWQPSLELGANYDRRIGEWDLSLVSLINRRYYRSSETDNDLNGAGAFLSRSTQDQQRDAEETILRGSLARDFGSAHHLEFGIEGALNSLDASNNSTRDTGSGPVIQRVPNANVLVEESRTEMFSSYTWRPADDWSVEARLAREQSTLDFTGDANQTVELAFVKPSIQVSHNLDERNQLRVRVYRDVGQLDFDDFVSAASAVDNLIFGGNPDLKPETAWRLEFGGDLRLPANIALTFALTHHWISDVADQVQIVGPGLTPGAPPVRFGAPGNIGDGEANSLTTRLTLPFGNLLPGARLTLNGTFWDTEVTDPVTGRPRAVSGRADAEVEGEFRQDFTQQKFSWGFNYFRRTETQTFRFNEIDTEEEGPYIDLFLESTAIPGIKARAVFANVANPSVRRQRYFFTPDRTGTVSRFEDRDRQFSERGWFILQLSGTF